MYHLNKLHKFILYAPILNILINTKYIAIIGSFMIEVSIIKAYKWELAKWNINKYQQNQQ